jgi:hypothetical protein
MPDKLPSAEELAKAIDMQCHAQGAAYFFARTEASFLIDSAFAAISADQRAQGRREAAEAYCETICRGIYHKHPENEPCNLVKVILGTASAEKTDKGEI